jgi:hypothetical protein
MEQKKTGCRVTITTTVCTKQLLHGSRGYLGRKGNKIDSEARGYSECCREVVEAVVGVVG